MIAPLQEASYGDAWLKVEDTVRNPNMEEILLPLDNGEKLSPNISSFFFFRT
jgi:hypothetical protein